MIMTNDKLKTRPIQLAREQLWSLKLKFRWKKYNGKRSKGTQVWTWTNPIRSRGGWQENVKKMVNFMVMTRPIWLRGGWQENNCGQVGGASWPNSKLRNFIQDYFLKTLFLNKWSSLISWSQILTGGRGGLRPNPKLGNFTQCGKGFQKVAAICLHTKFNSV